MTAPLYCEIHPELASHDTLFIHGNLASTAWWQPMLRQWRATGSEGKGRLIFADWRGCGQNPEWPGDQTFSIEDLARDFLALMDEKGIATVDVVGHSLGGLIAQQMMVLSPQRIRKAMLLDPVGPGGVVLDDTMYEAFRRMAAEPDLTRVVILSTVKNNADLDDALANRMAEDAFKAVRGIGSSVLEILKTVNIREDLKALRIPTLIVHGEHDAIIPLRDSQELAGLMPQANLEVLSDAGHCWNVEDPAAFTKRLKEWFI